MKPLTERKTRIQIGFLCIPILLMALLFVPECDDCYFAFWRYDSVQDFLLTRPSPAYGNLVGVPENGRYLGNLLGVLLAKLYFTDFGVLHGLIMGGGFLLLLHELSKIPGTTGISRLEAFSLSFFVLIFAPRGIYQEVYSWGAAWINYLLPMIGVLMLFRRILLRDADGSPHLVQIGLVSFLCCLFMEPTTLLLVFWAGMNVLLLRRTGADRPQALVFLAGSLLGALLMFTAPGYYHSTSETRFVSLQLISRNLPVILTQTFQRPAILAVLISFLFVWLLRRQQHPAWKALLLILLPLHALLLALSLKNTLQTAEYHSRIGILLSVLLAGLWCYMLAVWKNQKEKKLCIAVILGMCLLNGPLLIVTPVMPRNFFPSYLCLSVIGLLLYRAARGEGLGSFEKLRFAALAVSVALVFVYGANFTVYHDRLQQAQSEVAAGSESVTLPLVPFPGWSSNEHPGKGDLSYLIYDQAPWDVALDFIPYRP